MNLDRHMKALADLLVGIAVRELQNENPKAFMCWKHGNGVGEKSDYTIKRQDAYSRH